MVHQGQPGVAQDVEPASQLFLKSRLIAGHGACWLYRFVDLHLALLSIAAAVVFKVVLKKDPVVGVLVLACGQHHVEEPAE